MKKFAKGFVAAGLLCFGSAHATIRYTEAQIIEIETGETQISLFLQVLSGDAPPLGNGGTNSPPNRHYLTLASTAIEVESRKHMLAAALMAQTTGAVVRFRWDDASATPDRVEYMLVRE
ncbi:hypothetical protein JM946_13535 [Steroidobacter sp. S1-65]|uniref:Uncharacterized protein n=1 Tax=Steroidobacter gossypii TaxID=2805490 RepID=A0ABS1WXR9_9GAMM|nr:hypothetical protein [Steroidobacter gossypii]MBM0105758.1 hypothetical protein [Steroidobacter gossypii]